MKKLSTKTRRSTVKATLSCDEDGVGIVHNRFDKDAEWTPAKAGAVPGTVTARAKAHVRVSSQFFGWVASMAGTVRIAVPKKLVREYRVFLQGLPKEYYWLKKTIKTY